jgi:hypothetical protein
MLASAVEAEAGWATPRASNEAINSFSIRLILLKVDVLSTFTGAFNQILSSLFLKQPN